MLADLSVEYFDDYNSVMETAVLANRSDVFYQVFKYDTGQKMYAKMSVMITSAYDRVL